MKTINLSRVANALSEMEKNTNIIVISLSILFTFLIVSCDNKKDAIPHNIIPVASTVGDYEMLNLSQYITEIKYISLETNDSVLVSDIYQVICENEKILIDDGNCYLFDNDGKFSCTIGQRGQGPDEYHYIAHVSMCDNFIFLSDDLKLLVYDTTGCLVEKNNLQSGEFPAEYVMHTFRILPLKKDTFVMNVASSGNYYPKAILFATHQSNVEMIKEYTNYIRLNKLRASLNSLELGVMYRFKDNVRIHKNINDTIFTIDKNMEMKDAFVFDFGKYKEPLSFLEGRETTPSANNNYIFPFNISESLNHLFIEFFFGNHAPEPFEIMIMGNKTTDKRVFGVFDKRTGELTLMRQPVKGKFGFKNDIDNGPVIWPRYISSKNELVTFISAEDFLDYYDKIKTPTPEMTKIAKSISKYDNPILVIAKLKE